MNHFVQKGTSAMVRLEKEERSRGYYSIGQAIECHAVDIFMIRTCQIRCIYDIDHGKTAKVLSSCTRERKCLALE